MKPEIEQPRIIWEPLPGSQTLVMTCPANIIVYEGTRGPGKRVSFETPILTDSGWKNAGDVTYNDKLVAMDGTYTNLVGIFPEKNRPLYNVEFYDGAIVEADEEHRWLVKNNKNGYRDGWKVHTTLEMINFKNGFSVPYLQGAIPGNEWQGPDPYMLGYIIANGTTGSKNVTIYSIDDEILNYAKDVYGWYIYSYDSQTAKRAVCPTEKEQIYRNILGHFIGDQKYIPKELLEADAGTRLALLQGLMDGDGNCELGAKSKYSTVSEQLAKDVVYIVKSLGGWASYRWADNKTDFGDRGGLYRVSISHHNKFNPFRLKRKAEKYVEQTKFLTRGIKSITFSRYGDGVCFAVDHNDHCFVCGDFVITHNTDSQLMRFRRHVGQGFGRQWRGIIFDREYKNLDDLVSKSQRWFPEFDDGARFLSSKSDYRWVWKTGEELLFRAIKKDSDYWNYHGQEFPFIGWNEITKFPTDHLFNEMMSCNRSSYVPDITDPNNPGELPLTVMATCNPYGPGHNWVKRRFISIGKRGEIIKRTINVYNPRTNKREDVVKTQVTIFGSYRENKYLSPEYIAELETITDPNKRKAWLFGDWDVVAGGMFDSNWDNRVHVVEPFDIPKSWTINRSFDYGSSKPFSVGWWARSDGSDVKLRNGKYRSTVKGDLFRIMEWYGSNGRPNQGLRLLDHEISAGIIEREIDADLFGRVNAGPADNSIWDVLNGNSIAAGMSKPCRTKHGTKQGVRWLRSDKSSGSRVAGWEKIRKLLANSIPPPDRPREQAGIFVFNTCEDSIEQIPALPRDEKNPDDVDTEAEDHIGDEWRYAVLSASDRKRSSRAVGLG